MLSRSGSIARFIQTASEKATNQNGGIENDIYWALQFKEMSRRGETSLTKKTFEQFVACFAFDHESYLNKQGEVLPSNLLIEALFSDNGSPPLLWNWILDHLMWHYENNIAALAELDALLRAYPIFGTQFAIRVVQSMTE